MAKVKAEKHFRIDIDEEESYRPVVSEAGSLINARGIVANPSIGEVRESARQSIFLLSVLLLVDMSVCLYVHMS